MGLAAKRSGTEGRHGSYYFAFGLCVRSELALPELEPMQEQEICEPQVDISLGNVKATLPSARHMSGMIQVGNGDCLVTATKVARYHVRNGTEIIVDPVAGSSDRNVRLFLLGTALGALCHQRGLLPLHASAVEAGDRAIAFTGRSGAGKSTLAAQLQRRGYRVLCDDVCVISLDAYERPLAWPGLPRLKLWGDSVTALGRDAAALDRVHDDMDKFLLPLKSRASRQPIPLARLYVLDEDGQDFEGGVRPLTGTQAMDAVMANTYRGGLVAPMGRSASHFMQCASVVRHAGVSMVGRRWGVDAFMRAANELGCSPPAGAP
jgi:hypothetical protein